MSKRVKPHVKDELITPLEEFIKDAIPRIDAFSKHINFMSPVDGIGCLGYLRKASRDLRDAVKELTATVDFHAGRVRYMKEENRKRREWG